MLELAALWICIFKTYKLSTVSGPGESELPASLKSYAVTSKAESSRLNPVKQGYLWEISLGKKLKGNTPSFAEAIKRADPFICFAGTVISVIINLHYIRVMSKNAVTVLS